MGIISGEMVMVSVKVRDWSARL